MASTIMEALQKTTEGQTQLLQVRTYNESKYDKNKSEHDKFAATMRQIIKDNRRKEIIRKRVSELKNLAHFMLVDIGYSYELYRETVSYIRDLCQNGTDKEYNNAMKAFKHLYDTNKYCSPYESFDTVKLSLCMPLSF